jgi:hypothetical protein
MKEVMNFVIDEHRPRNILMQSYRYSTGCVGTTEVIVSDYEVLDLVAIDL